MTKQQLIDSIYNKNSFLCIGLDSDYNKLPSCILDNDDPIFEFNRRIIDATHKYAVAYKPNIAFYESRGSQGWQSLEKTVDYIRKVDDSIFIIADAKRGDIGNTSKQYAIAFFQNIDFDAVTVAPYMGKDSVTPFLSFDGKWVILLALTSNEGAYDFQFIKAGEKHLFETVIETSKQWGANEDNMMYVVGATKAEMLKDIRKIVPDNFLLVPGVGAQGGSLSEVCKYGINKEVGLLVNSSRGIIFASKGADFDLVAEQKAKEIQLEMKEIIASL
ncbi:MAG: orotidine-5'-phosphate decarboxylase [Bacteroidales bacterium]|jgi:orotidine-5'-phosphate decarboxylase|nr:orotidine-5'-phosphate decarboxylase [Bacteroidales bacterium]MDD2205611.1 orotidine-5'-phosphate decarboxylase [Bacteroidales bacterium]MDD3152065.1 orotidine-5'-phosphate decarboxylase [Bacteroidales bacterium]MDD3915001.1 orotidine-5'-phosphate decarboxylase [Bacteroidales bacterium]MDD4633736.1 orotidine-5'-phosphate decarboxylase [Bacteroidales bacterium]